MMNVYKIYDDAWEDIVGPEQLRGFTADQMRDLLCTNTDEEIVELVYDFVSKKNRDLAIEILGKFRTDETVINDVNERLLIDLLKIKAFDVEMLNIY